MSIRKKAGEIVKDLGRDASKTKSKTPLQDLANAARAKARKANGADNAEDITKQTDEALILDDAAVYPEGKPSLNKVGSGTGKFVSWPFKFTKDLYKGTKQSVATQLGGEPAIRGGVKNLAEDVIQPTTSFHKAVDNFQTNLHDSIKQMENGFKEGFKKYNMQSKSQPNRIANKLEELTTKFHSQKGIPIVKDLEDIVKAIQNGEISPSKGLRKYRALTGRLLTDSRRNMGPKELRNAEMSLKNLQNDSREVFRSQADIVGKDLGNPNFAKEVKALDDRYSRHFDFKKNKAIFRAGEEGKNSEAHNLISRIQTNPKKAVHSIDEFHRDMKTLESLSGSKGFATQQMGNLKDAMGSHLFHGESSTFKNYITHPSGRAALKKLWPEHKKSFDDWGRIFKETETLSGNLSGWMSKVFGMALGGTVGAQGGSAVGTLISGLGGALGASKLFNSKGFQTWAVKQFSKNPPKPSVALSALTKIMKGDQASARRVLDTTLGYTTTGAATVTGAAFYGKHVSEKEKAELDKSFRENFRTKSQKKLDDDFNSNFGR